MFANMEMIESIRDDVLYDYEDEVQRMLLEIKTLKKGAFNRMTACGPEKVNGYLFDMAGYKWGAYKDDYRDDMCKGWWYVIEINTGVTIMRVPEKSRFNAIVQTARIMCEPGVSERIARFVANRKEYYHGIEV